MNQLLLANQADKGSQDEKPADKSDQKSSGSKNQSMKMLKIATLRKNSETSEEIGDPTPKNLKVTP